MSDAAEILAPFDKQLPHEVAVRNKVEIIRYLISALYGSLDLFAGEHPVVASRLTEADLLGDRGFAEPDTSLGGGGYHRPAVREQPEVAWSAARAPQPARAQTGAQGPADVHRAAELDYARQVAPLLEGTSVPVQELLLLLSRRAATPELRTPSSFRAAYRTVTGRSLHDDLGAAVSSTRLGEPDATAITRRLRLDATSFGANRPLQHITRQDGAGAAESAEVVAYVRALRHEYTRNRPDNALGLLDALDRDLFALKAMSDAWGRYYETPMDLTLTAAWPTYAERLRHALGATQHAVVTMEQATLWLHRLRELTFNHRVHGRVSVTSDYPDNGCVVRAHMWAMELRRWGAQPRKVFVANAGKRLRMRTILARGAYGDQRGAVRFIFHTAPVVDVVAADGDTRPMVLDPTVAEHVLSIEQWVGLLGVLPEEQPEPLVDSPERLHQHFAGHLSEHPFRWNRKGEYPLDTTIALTDERAWSFPSPEKRLTVVSSVELSDREEDMLYRHSVKARRRALSREIWGLLLENHSDDTPAAWLGRIRSKTEKYGVQRGFLEDYPAVADVLALMVDDPEVLEQTFPLAEPDTVLDENSDAEVDRTAVS